MTAKTSKTERKPRTGPKADWKHVGGDIPPTLYERFLAEAAKQGVPQAVVLRWALAEYLPAEGDSE